MNSKWEEKRVNQEYQCIVSLIDNDAQEIVAVRYLFYPQIRKAVLENNRE